MLNLIGDPSAQEWSQAQRLRELIIHDWPRVEFNPTVRVLIVCPAYCYGQEASELDIIVAFEADTPLVVGNNAPSIRSAVFSLEVKSHTQPGGWWVDGNALWVQYPDRSQNATTKAFNQQGSLGRYLRAKDVDLRWNSGVVWLYNETESQLRAQCAPPLTFSSETTWIEMLSIVSCETPANRLHRQQLDLFRSAQGFAALRQIFERRISISELDRKQLERICGGQFGEQRYIENLGDQMLTFSGPGGSGKTLKMLQLAFHSYEKLGKRVLILTYNKALVADIRRLFAFHKLPYPDADRGLTIRTIHQHIKGLLVATGCIKHDATDYIKNFEVYKSRLIAELESFTSAEVERLVSRESDFFDWDFVFVDEAQDWPEDECKLLKWLYGYRNLVLAVGDMQQIRQQEPADWLRGLSREERKTKTQRVPLAVNLRQKNRLARFVSRLVSMTCGRELGMMPQPDLVGGRVTVILGKWSRLCKTPNYFTEILEELQQSGNSPIDLLLIVTFLLSDDEHSAPYRKLKEWGLDAWDGAIDDIRETCAESKEQIRIVNYQSCRGLEGWTAFALQLDVFWEQMAKYHVETKLAEALDLDYTDADLLRKQAAWRWVTIPMTRAMDHLIIHIQKPGGEFEGAIRRAAAAEIPDGVRFIDLRT